MSIEFIRSIVPAKYSGDALIPITEGASGAYVFSSGEKYIVKAALRKGLDSATWNSFVREHEFYTMNMSSINFIPRLEYERADSDYILLVMSRYEPLYRSLKTESDMDKIIGLLTDINAFPLEKIYIPPKITDDSNNPENDNNDNIDDKSASCIQGWLEVLGEHGGLFDKDIISVIASYIKTLMDYPTTLPEVLIHGDFHLGNILINNGSLIACDWQNVGVAEASCDLSFLLSRAGADGLSLDIKKIVEDYCTQYSAKSGNMLIPENVWLSMAKTDLGLGFYCWHEYLHGSSPDRVKNIYDKMVNAYKYIKSML